MSRNVKKMLRKLRLRQKNSFLIKKTCVGKNVCWSLFLIRLFLFNNNFIKKGLQHSCFTVNIAKFLRTPFSKNNSGRLTTSANACSKLLMEIQD